MTFKTVLLFGGSSDERMVSVASAQNLVNNFEFDEIWFWHFDGIISHISKEDLLRHQDAFEMEFNSAKTPFAYTTEQMVPFLKDKIVFLSLHGTEVEDGKLQTIFENAKVMFTGSGAKASQNAFMKDLGKSIVSKVGFKIAPQLIIKAESIKSTQDKVKKFFDEHKKIVLKPLAGGSSIGLFIIHEESHLHSALLAIKNTEKGDYLVEKFIEGRELTVGVMDNGVDVIALPPSEIVLHQGSSFDYKGKYLGLGTKEVTPAEINPDETKTIQALALGAHKALGCYGYSRTDLILNNGGVYFLETNTLPGLTKASFVPQQLQASGVSMTDFIKKQITLAEKRYKI